LFTSGVLQRQFRDAHAIIRTSRSTSMRLAPTTAALAWAAMPKTDALRLADERAPEHPTDPDPANAAGNDSSPIDPSDFRSALGTCDRRHHITAEAPTAGPTV